MPKPLLLEPPAESTPITCPEALTSGPPESPGWMAALVWIMPVSCSELPDVSSPAVICWFRATSEPPAALGVPPTPPALPRATTASPTEILEESPICADFRPEAFCSWMRAMSWLRS